MSLITSRARLLIATAAFAVAALVGAGVASAQTGSEEAQGAQLFQSLQQGSKSCADLTNSDFELVGEAWMGRAFGNSPAHEAMNRLMVAMMGSSGEQQMHEYMGRRVGSCSGGTVPNGFGRMMGTMAMMAGYQGAGGYRGTMGGQSGSGNGSSQGYGPGMMGGFGADQANNNDGDHGGVGWLAVAMIAMMAAVLIAFLILRRRSGKTQSGGPLAILDRRLAAGDIDREEHDQRRRLLGGGR